MEQKKLVIDFKALDSMDGTVELLETVRELLKGRLTVNRYEHVESSTDWTEKISSFIVGETPREHIAFLRGYGEGLKILTDLMDEPELYVLPGMVSMTEMRNKTAAIWLGLVKFAIQVHQGSRVREL